MGLRPPTSNIGRGERRQRSSRAIPPRPQWEPEASFATRGRLRGAGSVSPLQLVGLPMPCGSYRHPSESKALLRAPDRPYTRPDLPAHQGVGGSRAPRGRRECTSPAVLYRRESPWSRPIRLHPTWRGSAGAAQIAVLFADTSPRLDSDVRIRPLRPVWPAARMPAHVRSVLTVAERACLHLPGLSCICV